MFYSINYRDEHLKYKLGCVVRMVVDSLLPNVESGPNDHRKDAPPFIVFEKLRKQVMNSVNQWNAGSKVLIQMEMPIFWWDQKINAAYNLLFSLYLVKWTDSIEKLVMQMENNPLNSRHYSKTIFEPFISIKSPHSQQKNLFWTFIKDILLKNKRLYTVGILKLNNE